MIAAGFRGNPGSACEWKGFGLCFGYAFEFTRKRACKIAPAPPPVPPGLP